MKRVAEQLQRLEATCKESLSFLAYDVCAKIPDPGLLQFYKQLAVAWRLGVLHDLHPELPRRWVG